MEQFQTNIGELTSELHSIHHRQDAEKRQLTELKNLLKQTIATYEVRRPEITYEKVVVVVVVDEDEEEEEKED